MQQTKEPQGKILFKRTDIQTMKKDIKMLREFDVRKEAEKILKPATSKPTKIEASSPEMEKQRAFALKAGEAQVQAELKELEAQKETVFTKEKNQLLARQNNQEKVLNNMAQKEATTTNENQKEALEKKRWAVEREAVEAKKRMDDLEVKNKEAENQKAKLQQKIAQTNDALRTTNASVNERANPPTQTTGKPAPVNESEQRKKFMEDIEAWVNTDKKN